MATRTMELFCMDRLWTLGGHATGLLNEIKKNEMEKWNKKKIEK